MAIIENRTSEQGDVLFIKTTVPAIGIAQLTDWVDIVVGADAGKDFTKEFRYKLNNLDWSTWRLLTSANLQAVPIAPTDTFYAEYRYTRTGAASGPLEFREVVIKGTYESDLCGGYFSRSIYAQFTGCGDTEMLNWAINVLEKIYEQGIVPQYVQRTGYAGEDADYIAFWSTVTTNFAQIVHYGRQFAKYHSNIVLLKDHLKQRNIFFNG
jgi:hypothetical protein